MFIRAGQCNASAGTESYIYILGSVMSSKIQEIVRNKSVFVEIPANTRDMDILFCVILC